MRNKMILLQTSLNLEDVITASGKFLEWYCLLKNNIKGIGFILIIFLFSFSNLFAQNAKKEIVVAPALSEVPVAFSLLTHGNKQFVAFYNPDHQMVVASRNINEDKWIFQALPSKIGWDGHNSIAMKVDSDGQIHLSGNMHVDPLMYFRTTKPLDITSFKAINYMTGENEKKVTYPSFMTGPNNEFIYHYRDGGSGNGNEIYNVYDVKKQTWSRFFDKPFMDGKGERNAYMSGPSKGPDGYYHLVWVWRDSYLCETNNHLSYARSRNFKDWESVDGKPVELPLTIDKQELWVDPVPVKAGLINGGDRTGFDSKNRLVIAYQKFDEKGNNQLYMTKYVKGKWKIKQITDWNYRWYFSGGGGVHWEIQTKGVQRYKKNLLKVSYSHIKYGEGYLLVDENSFKVVDTVTVKSPEEMQKTFDKPETTLVKKIGNDCGKGIKGKKFHLEWETLPPNRDKVRKNVIVKPTILKVIEEEVR
ncbi:BNR repeat-containing protein [Bacteroides intestinalis]|mgnify:FL=1|uniref:BNR repeat-containing protein n=1 Tax=Bacteroides intestinalis TaxID=329854 RepID=UPI00189D2FF3|nr:BNR repeat-containing protein [Bacteroides intestinalis]